METISSLMRDVAASLWLLPGTYEDLYKRDFLKNKSQWGVDMMIKVLFQKGRIYQRGEKWYTYKKYAMSREMSGYELPEKARR